MTCLPFLLRDSPPKPTGIAKNSRNPGFPDQLPLTSMFSLATARPPLRCHEFGPARDSCAFLISARHRFRPSSGRCRGGRSSCPENSSRRVKTGTIFPSFDVAEPTATSRFSRFRLIGTITAHGQGYCTLVRPNRAAHCETGRHDDKPPAAQTKKEGVSSPETDNGPETMRIVLGM
jgi:hypothetical protein